MVTAGAVLAGFQPRASALGQAAALVELGPSAHIRGRLEKATAALLTIPAEAAVAVEATDAALGELAALAHQAADVRGQALAPDLVADLVAEAAQLRSYALAQVQPLPSGYRGEFLARVAPGAIVGDWQHGVPASITMSQAILESGWGKVAPGFNLFGIKGEGSAGSEVHRVVEWRKGKRSVRRAAFRSYRSMAESLEDHARLLGTSERYAAARAAGDDTSAYARALQGKYATDPRYASKLLDLADRYGLARFDWRGPAPLATPPVASIAEVQWTAFLDGSDPVDN